MNWRISCIILMVGIPAVAISLATGIDPSGYILYCPCMGRFGNQAEQFLGAMAFAKNLNRTFVLPPWVEYHPRTVGSVQVPFKTYFRVANIRQYHRTITMETFMAKLSPEIWPPSKRTVFCYGARDGDKENDCNAKDGSPFGPFWDTFNVDFVKSVFYGSSNLNFEPEKTTVKRWMKLYPAEKHLVIAFTGAPGSFPVKEQHIPLQKYLVWSADIDSRASTFIREKMSDEPFLGIHMRHGSDWGNACVHIDPLRHLFASAQCLGFNFEHGQLTKELCLPSVDTVINQVKATIKKMKVKNLFVATDSDPMISRFTKVLKKLQVNVVSLSPASPHVDLAILAKATHYIGNCVSTFSAFATRERRVNEKSVAFWAFPDKTVHTEL